MSKKMLINATLPEEDRVAIVEDGTLTELDIEIAGHQQTKSNIYKGEVIRVEQGLQAAFIDYGAQRPGFLQIGEIHPSLYPKRDDENSHRRPAITDILKRGQQLLVQVVKEERGNKGAALTTEISLPGRYMVLMPESSSRGISRKIDNDQVRKGIKQALAGLDLPDNMGYIIRTAAIDQPPEELKRDFDYLLNTYNSIIAHSEKAKAPALIYQESNLVIRSIRDYFSPEIDEVLIDDREVFQKARDFFKAVMPEYAHLVKLHQERRPIFARYQIEEQISQLSSNTVNLPSGGSIVLDQTEALVAIDVNSGKMASEQDVEATAHRVNVEAATEVARQLRLRDMGGLIVIDFIDMRQRKNAREVEKTLKSALKIDKARVTVGRISHQFGLLEMSRQRIKANLGEGTYHACPHCQGNGRIRSEESRSVALLRRIQAGTAKGNIETVRCTTALDTANYLLNTKRHELFDLEQRYKLTIEIKGDALYLPEQVEIDFIKQTRDHNDQRQLKELTPLVDTDLSERAAIEVAPTAAANDEEGTASDEAGEREPTKKPRRRRRSGRRRSDRHKNGEQSTDSSGQQAEANSEKAAIAQEAQPQATEQQAVQTQQAAEKISEPTASTPTISDQEAGQETVKATALSDSAPQQTTPEAAASAEPATPDSEEPKKKPARRRRTTKKSEEPQEATSTATTAEEQPTEAEEKPKRRTTRRKTTAKKAEPEVATEAAETSKPKTQGAEIEEEAVNKKPTRRRRTTKTSEEEQQAASTDTAAAEQPTEAEEKPKRRTARRKTTTKKADTEATAATTETATPASEDVEAEKKPTRRRRTTKTIDKEPSTTTAKASETASAPEVEEKPKRTTRRKTTTQKETDDTTKAATETAGEDASEKKPVRRRRTTKKAAEAADSSATTDSTTPEAGAEGEEKPKRRAPRRKKSAEETTSPPTEEN